jgi:hypothetical protein
MLSKYYSFTDYTHIYRVAMSTCAHRILNGLLTYLNAVLHPTNKVTYFRTHKWPEDWITTALNLVCEEWCKNYKDNVEILLAEPTQMVSGHKVFVAIRRLAIHSCLYKESLTQKYFGAAACAAACALVSDPLETYLANLVILSVGNPLIYWQSIISSNAANAPLARMALDFLSTPGQCLHYDPDIYSCTGLAASTDLERAFS